MSLYRYNLEDFNTAETVGIGVKGPIWMPVRLIINVQICAFLFLVPILYGVIFRFRMKHAKTGTYCEFVTSMFIIMTVDTDMHKLSPKIISRSGNK